MSDVILQIAVATPLRRLFDYLPPENFHGEFTPGCRVIIPFGRQQLVGIIIGTKQRSDLPLHKLRRIKEIIDQTPVVPESIVSLCVWASQYYQHALGEVLTAAIPKLLRDGKPAILGQRRFVQDVLPAPIQPAAQFEPQLNADQQLAVDQIIAANTRYQPFLLQGVTGSGKTEVYLRCIADVVNRGKQSLVLVPEIGLTPQTVARFAKRFDVPVVMLHSGLNDRERLDTWLLAMRGEAKIVIGTRSAIFIPLPDLGLIVVDEEHDTSYKQQDSFGYSARDLALVRAQQAQIPVVLGSATPSLESLYNVKRDRYQWLHLPQRAGNAIKPKFNVIDLRKTKMRCGLTPPVFYALQDHLQQGNQVLVFINRRGYAPILQCHACGWVADCKHCDAHLTLHRDPPFLQCHHCGESQRVMTHCPTCQHDDLQSSGVGTQRLQEYLQKHFTEWPVLRIDRDTTRRKHAMPELLNQINSGAPAILLGTQMLAKGHHFPNVTLVVILNCDAGFFSADFRACEHTGQLITQVSGRAGREAKPGEVYIQTHHPEHPLLLQLIQQGYQAFADSILREREAAGLPPYSYLAVLRAQASDKQAATDLLDSLKSQLPTANGCALLGPIPATMEKRAGRYRSHLLIQAQERKHLQHYSQQLLDQIELLKPSKRIRWSLDIDPLEVI